MNNFDKTAACLALSATLLGCSSSGGDYSPPAAAQAPQIAGPVTLEMDQGTMSPPLSFRFSDDDTTADKLQVSIASGNEALIPLAGAQLQGSGADRVLRLTPDPEATGSTLVTLTARDAGGLSTAYSLAVRVNPVLVSFRALTNDAFAKADSADESKVLGVTVLADADDDEQAFDALLR